MTRNDIFLTIFLLVGALAMIFFLNVGGTETGSHMDIYQDNVVVYSADLTSPGEYTWQNATDHVTVAFDSSGARVTSSSCPDQYCVHQGNISTTGQSLVCLPNRVVVRLTNVQSDDELDAVLY